MATSAALISSSTQAHVQAAEGWYAMMSDEGTPVPNLRLPVELFSEVDELPGLVRVGSEAPDVTVVEFYDYNCPFCRKAAKDLEALVASDKGLRLGLVNNPVLSPQSKEAARVELAFLKMRGSGPTYEFHKRLYRVPGKIDGEKPCRPLSNLARAETRSCGMRPETTSDRRSNASFDWPPPSGSPRPPPS